MIKLILLLIIGDVEMKYDTSMFKGVIVAFNTIFDKNDEINVEAMKLLAKKYCEVGVNGLYVC